MPPTNSPYIPPSQQSMRQWMQDFASGVSADPEAFGLESGDAAQISADVDAFSNALDVALDPNTRTPVAVAAKDEAKATALATCRLYAQQIKNTPGISNEQLESLGINVDDETPTPHPVASSHPVITMAAMANEQHTLRWADSDAPNTSRSKPFGQQGVVLYRAFHDVGTSAQFADAQSVGVYTREPMFIENPEAEKGRLVTYWARWVNTRGEQGALSDPLTEPVT